MIKSKSSTYLKDIPTLSHGFFGRSGGVSDGIYKSLNCGTHSFDIADNVLTNRNRAVTSLSNEATLVEIHQTHSNIVHVIEDDFTVKNADGAATDRKNVALSIVTADCAPILFSDPSASVIGAAHAGWQGALTGIIENTVCAMCSLGAARENIIAAIGPCITQQSYEVGAEFYDRIANADFFIPSTKPNHFLFDLEGFVLLKLKESQIRIIDPLQIDTYDKNNDYFSYRRKTHLAENDYGRQISIILQK